MKRSTTPSYIAQYRLLCTPDDGKFIGHCLFLGCKTYNIMVGEANKRLNSYYRDKEVNAIRMKQRKKGYELSDAEKDILKAKRKQYGLSEYAFQVYLKVHGKQISNFLDANTVVTEQNHVDFMHLTKEGHRELAEALAVLIPGLS